MPSPIDQALALLRGRLVFREGIPESDVDALLPELRTRFTIVDGKPVPLSPGGQVMAGGYSVGDPIDRLAHEVKESWEAGQRTLNAMTPEHRAAYFATSGDDPSSYQY